MEDGQCLQKGIYSGIEFVVFCWYILWDLSVLTAYIRKINELIKNSKATQHFQRTKKVLGKIIILTLLYELSFVFYFGITRLEEINLFGDFVKETKIFEIQIAALSSKKAALLYWKKISVDYSNIFSIFMVN